MRSGVVSIVGRPNVGKSTLLNTLLERKLAITSDKAETTRNTILGVYNDDDVQIVFVDTPGIHKPLNRLGTVLNQTAFHAIQDVDVVLFLVDAKTGIGKGDLFILNLSLPFRADSPQAHRLPVFSALSAHPAHVCAP